MPKLNPTKAADVKKAGETGNRFGLLEVGKYKVKLIDVESTTARSSGNPMWIWKFETTEALEPGVKDGKGKEIWYRTVIQDNTLWDLDRVFAAFDADPDTDTDELIGDEIVVFVDHEIIGAGKRVGQTGHVIKDFFTLAAGTPKDDDFEELTGHATDSPEF